MTAKPQQAVYSFPSYRNQALILAQQLALPCFDIGVHHFPDKESRVTLPQACSKHALFCLSLDYPNNKLIELLLAVKTARQQGVERISLIAPYLCYMRQDTAFHDGEAVSQQIIGQWLAELVDDVITVDPHLHRVTSLDEVMPRTRTIVTTATQALGEFVPSLQQTVILLGPDEESRQWVEQVAAVSNSPFGVASKVRHSDTDVAIALPEDLSFANQHIILVDDVLSSGHTLAVAAQQLYAQQAKQVDVLVTHALFAPGATDTLKQADIRHVYSTDSISHASNCISLSGLLADAIQQL